MPFQTIPIDSLVVNPANDRHGELQNETLAIAWLFRRNESHMRNLASDIAESGGIFEEPLVLAEADSETYVVFDGNRRVTCLKLILAPELAPTSELRTFFGELNSRHAANISDGVSCRVETDREIIDEIIYRRHTGVQGGVGQSKWDDRQKRTFVERTGRADGANVSDEIERLLREADMLPDAGQIPRSTLQRLCSSEGLRNRIGVSLQRGQFRLTHEPELVLPALSRIARDLAAREVVLGDLWNNEGKTAYLDRLNREGLLPDPNNAVVQTPTTPGRRGRPPVRRQPRQNRPHLILPEDHGVVWIPENQRHRDIWEELQSRLFLAQHPNAIAVLLRVLIDLSTLHCERSISELSFGRRDTLAQRMLSSAEALRNSNRLTANGRRSIVAIADTDTLFSTRTMNQYVHSDTMSPAPQHLVAIWDSSREFVVACLNSHHSE
ncbi:hypothetical protein [Hyphobacterium sp.]|uniref:hypothetical protein n=1 Tax=Hyphobacterium sp. TaxID=2004662 RepID=UPI003BAB1463